MSLAKVHLHSLVKKVKAKGKTAVSASFQLVAQCIHLSSIDQAFMLWGITSIAIFSLAQFSTISWATQSIIDTAITAVGIAWTSGLTWKVAAEANLRWVVFLWAVLMTLGMGLTAYGIFYGVSLILVNLCPLWLGLCALGYGLMAVKMRSHSFTAAALIHGAGVLSISPSLSWQFLASGLIMALTLFFFSFVPWDMRALPETGPEVGEPCQG